ncbi:hypothetical protein Tco_0796734 [Tanacetum coccineum]
MLPLLSRSRHAFKSNPCANLWLSNAVAKVHRVTTANAYQVSSVAIILSFPEGLTPELKLTSAFTISTDKYILLPISCPRYSTISNVGEGEAVKTMPHASPKNAYSRRRRVWKLQRNGGGQGGGERYDLEDVPLESISCSISALQNMDSKGSSSGSSKNRNEPVKPSSTKIAKQQRKATIQKKEEIKIKQEAHQQWDVVVGGIGLGMTSVQVDDAKGTTTDDDSIEADGTA